MNILQTSLIRVSFSTMTVRFPYGIRKGKRFECLVYQPDVSSSTDTDTDTDTNTDKDLDRPRCRW